MFLCTAMSLKLAVASFALSCPKASLRYVLRALFSLDGCSESCCHACNHHSLSTPGLLPPSAARCRGRRPRSLPPCLAKHPAWHPALQRQALAPNFPPKLHRQLPSDIDIRPGCQGHPVSTAVPSAHRGPPTLRHLRAQAVSGSLPQRLAAFHAATARVCTHAPGQHPARAAHLPSGHAFEEGRLMDIKGVFLTTASVVMREC